MVPRAMGGAARKVLLGTAFLRAVATGMAGVLLGVYLAELGLSAGQVGAVAGAGLAGAAVGALVMTLRGQRAGRGALITLALLASLGGLLLAIVSHPLALAAVAFLGMVNGMGRDRGASAVLEQALLPATTTPERRTAAFAWYAALQDAGHSLGSLAAGLPALLIGGLALDGCRATGSAWPSTPSCSFPPPSSTWGCPRAAETAAEIARSGGTGAAPFAREAAAS